MTTNAMQASLSEGEFHEIVFFIASHLREPKGQSRHQLYRIVQVLGEEKAVGFMKQAIEIEKNGGMLTNDKRRKRTVGGIFFHLVKHCDDPAVRKLFPARKPPNWKVLKQRKKQMKVKRAAQNTKADEAQKC